MKTSAFETRQIEVDGHKVGLLESGPAGAPTVLFAHCSLAFNGLWKGVMQGLNDRWRCISIDMPGHGVSDRGNRARSLQLQAVDYVLGAAETAEKPAHLVGLSLGGAVMARVAVRAPEAMRSLTLIEPVLFHLLNEKAPELVANDRELMKPVYDACMDGRYQDGARAFMENWGQPGQFDRMPAPLREQIARALSFLAEDFEMVHSAPKGQISPDDISAIAAPVLLAQGERTQESAKVLLDEIQELIPHAERFEAAGAGHLSPVDDPAAIAARLATFFEKVERG